MKIFKSKRGMTVVEIVVSLAILGLISIGFTGFFTDSFKFQSRNQETVSIQKIAEETMEKLKNNRGEHVVIGVDTLNITSMDEGDTQILSDDYYEYKITVNAKKSIEKGSTFYDITINVISKSNNSISGTINSTVQVDSADKVDESSAEVIYIRYYDDDVLLKEDKFYGGTYLVTSYIPSKQGYIFTNWIDDSDFPYNIGDEINFDEEIVFDNEFGLYAEWRAAAVAEYTIEYRANGGTGSMASQTVTAGNSVTLSKNVFSRTGYIFKGWSTSETATTVTYVDEENITPTAYMDLYAVWEAEEVVVIPEIEAATLAKNASWYKGSTAKSSITTINIVDSYTSTGNETETWYADVKNSGLIKCYIEGTTLTIAGNGAGKIYANESCVWTFGRDDFSSVTSINGLTLLDTSNVIDMSFMFDGCSSLTKLDVSNFDTSNVTDMGYMFSGCSSLTSISIDASGFNTENVTNVTDMFSGCSSLTSIDVSNFKTSNATDMRYMFSGCSSLINIDVSGFNTENVTDMMGMFSGCSSLTSINVSNFKTSNVIYMINMFSDCSSLTSIDVSEFNTENVTSMMGMFSGCSSLTSINGLTLLDTSNVTSMQSMFFGCSSLTSIDVHEFKTSNVTSMQNMFFGCSSLTSIDVHEFKTSNVTNTSHMFANCEMVSYLDLSNFDMSKVEDMSNMFYNMLHLSEITLGEGFSFSGQLPYLPTPNSEYILGADGNWYAASDGVVYDEVEEIPSNKADTYYAVPSEKEDVL